MFILPGKESNEFKQLYESHRMSIAASNVYFHTIRGLKLHNCKILDMKTYKEYYLNYFNDIEMESHPIDVFMPVDRTLKDPRNLPEELSDEHDIFEINTECKEFQRFSNRITLEKVLDLFPETHEIHITLKQAPDKLQRFIIDGFYNYSILKYLDVINELYIEDLGIMKPVMEYTVENIDIKKLKSYLSSKRINEEKYAKWGEEMIFNPTMARIQTFYSQSHNGIDTFDAQNLLMRLITNIVSKTDIYIVTSIYLTLSYSMADIMNENMESPGVIYVRDVLSKV